MAGSVTSMVWDQFSNTGDIAYYVMYRTLIQSRDPLDLDNDRDRPKRREDDERLR